jgi:hypothetical protein
LVARDHLPCLVRGFPRRFPVDATVPARDRRTCIVPRELDVGGTTALIQRCRQEQTTVHGALCAAQVLAAAEEVESARSVPLVLGSAVSLRAQLQPPVGEAVGFFVSLVSSTHRVGRQTAFWGLARECRQQVTQRVERGEPWVMLAASGWGMGRFRRWIPFSEAGALKLAEPAEFWGHGATGITNLGLLDIPEQYGPLRLEALHFAGALSALCNLGSSAVTFAGQLRWNYIYQEPSIRRQRVEGLADRALQRLRDAIGSAQ